MQRVFLCFCCRLAAAMAAVSVSGSAVGQQDSYSLQVEVLIQPVPQDRIAAQEWSRVFQGISRSAVFRSGRAGEKTRIEETEFRSRKGVKAVGILNRTGTISFTGHTFQMNQPQPLREWLDRLEKFGANGPPEEDSTWGLDDDQFKQVLQLLAAPVSEPVDLRSPLAAIASLKLPSEFHVRLTEEAQQIAGLITGRSDSLLFEVKGLSKGTVLAAALAQSGLGFRPMAEPGGGFVIEVDRGDEGDNLYPVGWKNTGSLYAAVKGIAKSVEVDLENVALTEVLSLIAAKLEVPVVYSTYWLTADGKDLSKLTYSRKPDKLAIERLLNSISLTLKIGLSLRTDETGQMFLWVTRTQDFNSFNQRFKHVRPAE